jgi:hypothetical protein
MLDYNNPPIGEVSDDTQDDDKNKKKKKVDESNYDFSTLQQQEQQKVDESNYDFSTLGGDTKPVRKPKPQAVQPKTGQQQPINQVTRPKMSGEDIDSVLQQYNKLAPDTPRSKSIEDSLKKSLPPHEYERITRQRRGTFDETAQKKYSEASYNDYLTRSKRLREEAAAGKKVNPNESQYVNQTREEIRRNLSEDRVSDTGEVQKSALTQWRETYGDPQEGLVGSNPVKRLQDFDVQGSALTPEADENGVIKSFGGKALIDASRLKGLTGGELRKAANKTYASFLGFNPEEQDTISEALKLIKGGDSSLFVTKTAKGEKSVDDVEQMLDEGNYLPSGDKSLVQYDDPNAETLKVGLLARVAKASGDSSPEKVKELWDKYQEVTEPERKDADDLVADREAIIKGEVDDTWTKKLADAFRSTFGRGKDDDFRAADIYTALVGGSKDFAKDVTFSMTDEGSGGLVRQIPPESKSDIQKLLAIHNYETQTKIKGVLGELAKKPENALAFASNPILGYFVHNYLPSDRKLLDAGAMLGSAMVPKVGLAIALDTMSEQLKDSDPTTYNIMMTAGVISMGGGHILNDLRPVLGSRLVAGGQAALATGQTATNYVINRKAYLTPDGGLNFKELTRDLIVDIPLNLGLAGVDVTKSLKAPKEPNQMLNMVVRNSETGDFGMFVMNPDSKVLEFRTVDPSKVESWEQAQIDSKKQYIKQDLAPEVFDNLIKTGQENVSDAFKNLIWGTSNIVRDRAKILEESQNVRTRQRINPKTGETMEVSKVSNPLAVVNEDTTLSKVKSYQKSGEALAKTADGENRSFAALKLIEEYQAPLNMNTNVIGGDGNSVEVINNLKEQGLVNVDSKGQITTTPQGRAVYQRLNASVEGFQKLIADTESKFGKGKNISQHEVGEEFAKNTFVAGEKKEQEIPISDLSTMGENQRKALALAVAKGDLEFDSSSGVLRNTEFKISQEGTEYNFGKKGYRDTKLFTIGKNLEENDVATATATAKELLGPNATKEAISKALQDGSKLYGEARSMTPKNGKVTYTPQEVETVDSSESGADTKPDKVATPQQVQKLNDFRPLTTEESLPKTSKITIKESDTGRLVTFTKDKYGMYRAGNAESLISHTALEEHARKGDYLVQELVSAQSPKPVEETPKVGTQAEERAKTKEGYKEQSSEVQKSLVPNTITDEQAKYQYQSEADVLNAAIFGKTAKEFREEGGKGNQRDNAEVEHLLVMSNLQNLNKEYISLGLPREERVKKLNREAIKQLTTLSKDKGLEAFKRYQENQQEGGKKFYFSNLHPEDIPTEEVSKLRGIFGKNADEDTVRKLAVAIRDQNKDSQFELLHKLTGEDYSKNPSKLAELYANTKKTLTQELPSDISRIYTNTKDTIRKLVTGDADHFILPEDTHAENELGWRLGHGEIKVDSGTKVDLSDEKYGTYHIGERPNAVTPSKVDPTRFYVNEHAMDTVRRLLYGDRYRASIDGLAISKAEAGLLYSQIKSAVNGTHDAEFTKTLTPADKVELTKITDSLAKAFDNGKGGAADFIHVNPNTTTYSKFRTNSLHEATHKALMNLTGSKLLFSDDGLLSSPFRTPEGKKFTQDVRKSDFMYKKFADDHMVMSHEVLAMGTDKDTLHMLGIHTPEQMQDYAKVYADILGNLKKHYGEESTKIVERYADPEILNSVKDIRTNEERIRQNRLQDSEGRLGVPKDSRESSTSKAGSGEMAGDAEHWGGSGVKRVKLTRFTKSGDPTDLSGVGGAETLRRKLDGGKPTFNFYAEDPSGNTSVENDFKNTSLPAAKIEGEYKLLDFYNNKEAQTVYQNLPFPLFQEWAEAQGFDGFYNSSPDMADAFRYRTSLFDNESNRRSFVEPQLRKEDYDFAPQTATVGDVEKIVKRGNFSMIASEDMKGLKADLDRAGLRYLPADGVYKGTSEDSLLVYYRDEDAKDLIQQISKKHGQESVLHGEDGEYTLEYNNGVQLKTSDVEFSDAKKGGDGTFIRTKDGDIAFTTKFPKASEEPALASDEDLKKEHLAIRHALDDEAKQLEYNLEHTLNIWRAAHTNDTIGLHRAGFLTNKEFAINTIIEAQTLTRKFIEVRQKISKFERAGFEVFIPSYWKNSDKLDILKKDLSEYQNKFVSYVKELESDPSMPEEILNALKGTVGKLFAIDNNDLEFSGMAKYMVEPSPDNYQQALKGKKWSKGDLDTRGAIQTITEFDKHYKYIMKHLASELYGDGVEFMSDKAKPPKVVKSTDENGDDRITVYHGGRENDDVTSPIKNDKYTKGRFFSTDPKVASWYGKKVSAASLDIKNPYIVDAKEAYYSEIPKPKEMEDWATTDTVDTDLIADWAHRNGYDGVIIKNVTEATGYGRTADDYIVFNHEQISPKPQPREEFVKQEGFESKQQEIDTSDEKLKNADFGAWVDVASRLVNGGFLSDGEVDKIHALAEAKNVEGLHKFVLGLNKQGVLELFVDFLRVNPLVGTKNLSRNTISNELHQTMNEVARIPSFVVDFGLAKMVNKLAGGENTDRTILAPQPFVYAKSLWNAVTEGLPTAGEFMVKGQGGSFEHPQLFRDRTTGWAMLKPLEVYTKYGFRLQEAADIPFKTQAYNRALDEIVHLRMKNEKISKEEAESQLTTEEYSQAWDTALYLTFQDKNWISDKYYKVRDGQTPVVKALMNLAVPYIKTPLNVAKVILDYTGFYPLLKEVNKEIHHKEYDSIRGAMLQVLDKPECRKAISYGIGKGMVGWTAAYIGYQLGVAGMLKSFFDRDDKKERDEQTAKGTSFGALNVKGYSVDISSLTPMSFFLLAGAAFAEAESDKTDKVKKATDHLTDGSITTDTEAENAERDLSKAQNIDTNTQAISRILKNFALQVPLASQAIKGYDDNEVRRKSGGGNMLEALVNQFISPNRATPAVVQEIAKTKDDKERVTRTGGVAGGLDTVKSGIPYVRETLPVKKDMLGNPVQAPYGLDPFKTRKISQDPLINELDKFNITITDSTSGDAVEKNEALARKGKYFEAPLRRVIESKEYSSSPDKVKKDMLEDTKRYLSPEYVKDKLKPEEENHNLNMIIQRDYFTHQIKDAPNDFDQDREITDKKLIQKFKQAGVKNLTWGEVASYAATDRDFLRKNFLHNFMVSKDMSKAEAEKNFNEFQKDKALTVIQWFLNQKIYEERTKRLTERKEELIKEGKSEDEISKALHSESSKLGWERRRQPVNKITMRKDRTRERIIKSAPQSTNIEDLRQ